MKALLMLVACALVVSCTSPPPQEQGAAGSSADSIRRIYGKTGVRSDSTAVNPGKDEIPPDSILTEPLMRVIMADVHYIEAALLIDRNRGRDVNTRTAFLYQGLYAKYRISQERFQQNLAWYRESPERFMHLYEGVNQELIRREKNWIRPAP